MEFNILKFFKDYGGELIGDFDGDFNDFCVDSRKVNAGDIFVAMEGKRVDSHFFVMDAISNGARGAIVQRRVGFPEGSFIYIVPSTVDFLISLGEQIRNLLHGKVIGITGSAGKTTTKEMVNLILSQRFKTIKTEGNMNTEISLPIFLWGALKANSQYIITEMGIQRYGDMDTLSKIVKPQISVVLNVGETHLEFLGDTKKVAEEKTKILKESEIGILNAEDSLIMRYSAPYKIQKFFFGETERVDLRGKILNMDNERMSITLSYNGKSQDTVLPFSGIHFFYDILAAVSVAITCGLDFSNSLESLKAFSPIEGRGKVLKLSRGVRIIDETYNSNPFSFRRALESLKGHKSFLIIITGDMLELGEASSALHFKTGTMFSQIEPDLTIVVGNYSSYFREGAESVGIKNVFSFEDKREALHFVKGIEIPDDSVIFVKGSRGMFMEDFIVVLKERLKDG